MRVMTIGLLVAMAGCGTRPLVHDDGCQVGNPRPISDGFQGSELDSRCWSAEAGEVKVGGGTVTIGGGTGYNFAELASAGAGGEDFALRARVALRGTGASSTIALGWRGEHGIAFLMPVQTSPASWHALVNNESVELQHTMLARTDYVELELARAGGVASFTIDGQLVDSRAYADDLSASTVRISAGGDGSIVIDSIELR